MRTEWRRCLFFGVAGLMTVAAFGAIAAPQVCDNAYLWLDASQTNTMTFSDREITEWRSVNGGVAASAYTLTGSDAGWTPSGPRLSFKEASAPLVSFGSSSSCRDLAFPRSEDIKEVFMVAKVEKSGNAFLIGDSDTYHFHRGASGEVLHGEHGVARTNGTVYVNGVAVTAPTSTTMPESLSLFDAQANDDKTFAASQLCYDRKGNTNSDPRRGGKDIAEVLLFTNALTVAERQTVRDYLMKKWNIFGIGEASVVRAHPRLTLGLDKESLIGFKLLDGAAGAITNLTVRFDLTNATPDQITDIRVWRQKYDASAGILPFAFFERDAVDLLAAGLGATRRETGDSIEVAFAATNVTDALTLTPKSGTADEGDYVWVTAHIDEGLSTNAQLFVSFAGDRVQLTSGDFRLHNQQARSPHRSFPFRYQIGAFLRQDSLVDNGTRDWDIFTSNAKERFETLTDVLPIYSTGNGYSNGKFYISGWDESHNDTASTARLRRLRDAYNPDCMIRISVIPRNGISANGISGKGFEVAGANAVTRRQFAEAIVDFIREKQCDGLDVDYEWVQDSTNHREWQNIGKMLRELSEHFFEEGYVLSFATRSYDWSGSGMPYSASDYGAFHVCDYMMVQSYGGGWLNSSPSVHRRSLAVCTNRLLPKRRVVMGQAAYESLNGHMGWDGCSSKIESETDDPFRRFDMDIWWANKYDSYWPFEGMSSLQAQCMWARRENLGGVMSWGYYTDPTWEGWNSFGRHQSKAIWPMPNAWATPEVVERDGESWYQLKKEDDWFWLADHPTVHAELANDITFQHDPLVIDEWTGVLNGNGHTLIFDDDTWIVSEQATGLIRTLRGTVRDLKIQMNSRVFTVAARWNDEIHTPDTGWLLNSLSGENPVGVLAAVATDSALIESVAVTLGEGSEVKGVQSVGGLVGKASGAATIRNSSVEVGGKLHIEVRNIWDTLFQPISPSIGALVGLVEGSGVTIEESESSVVEGGDLQDLDAVPDPAYELDGAWREPSGWDTALPQEVDVRSQDWALEVVLSLPNYSASSLGRVYPQLIRLVGATTTVALSVNGEGAGELFLTGSNTASYAHPISRTAVRGNGDVGSGVPLTVDGEGRVTLVVENRAGELRVIQNGETILVTDKNNSSDGYLKKAFIGAGLSGVGGGSILSVRLKTSSDGLAYPEGYGKLIFDEEFGGDTLDASKWEKVPVMTSGAPNWRQYTSHREDLVAVSNGCLVLTGVLNDFSDGDTRKFLCGQIQSNGKFSFKYGKVEIRAKFENQSGAWPAMWMMPQDSIYGGWPNSGEIDITERLNSDAKVYQTAHFGYNNRDSTSGTTATIANGEFNVYGLEWTADAITWSVNGVTTHTYANDGSGYLKWPFDADFYFILSQQLEGSWVGQVSDTSTLPVRMFVDYVRVWQRDEDDLRENAYLWLDASDASTITTNEAGEITAWASANQAGKTASVYTLSSESPSGPQLLVDDEGRRLVSFGSTTANRDLSFERTTDLRTVFMVARLEQSPNAFLLGDSSAYNFHRGENSQLFSGHAPESIRSGSVFVNGAFVRDPTSTVPTDELALFEIHATSGVTASQLCYDRAGNGNTPRRGGKDIAELVLFKEALDEYESAKIRRTLMEKWNVGAEAFWTVTEDGIVKVGASVPTLITVRNNAIATGAEIGNSEDLAALSTMSLLEAEKEVTLSFTNLIDRIVAGADTRLAVSNTAKLVVLEDMKATLADGVRMGSYQLEKGGTLRVEDDASAGRNIDDAFFAGGAGTYEFKKIHLTGGFQRDYSVRVTDGDEISFDGANLGGRCKFAFDIQGGRVVFPAVATTWFENSTYSQSGGEFISLATGEEQSGTGNGFMLGFNNVTMTLDITGGLFAVTNSSLNFYCPVTLNVGGAGTVRAKGYFKSNQQATINVNEGGTLDVGALGFVSGTAVLNLKGGTLRGYEKNSVVHDNVNLHAPSTIASAPDGSLTLDGTFYYGSSVTLAAGSTLTLPSGGAVTFKLVTDCAGVKVTDGLLDFGTVRGAELADLSGTGSIRITLTDAERLSPRAPIQLFKWSGSSYAGNITVIPDIGYAGTLAVSDGYLTFTPTWTQATQDASGNTVYASVYPALDDAPLTVADEAVAVSVASTKVCTVGAMVDLPADAAGDILTLVAGPYRICLNATAEESAILLSLGYWNADGTWTTGFGAGVRVTPGPHALSLACSATNGTFVAIDGIRRDAASNLKFGSEVFTNALVGASGVGLYACDTVTEASGLFAYPVFGAYPEFNVIDVTATGDPLELKNLDAETPVAKMTVFAALSSPAFTTSTPALDLALKQNNDAYVVEAFREGKDATRIAWRTPTSSSRTFASQTVASRETAGHRVWHFSYDATGGTYLDINGQSAASSSATRWQSSFVTRVALGLEAGSQIGARRWIAKAAEAASADDPLAGLVETPDWFDDLATETRDYLYAKVGSRVATYEVPAVTFNGASLGRADAIETVRVFGGDPETAHDYEMNLDAPSLDAGLVGLSMSGDLPVNASYRIESKDALTNAWRVVVELPVGSTQRTFVLPQDAESSFFRLSAGEGAITVGRVGMPLVTKESSQLALGSVTADASGVIEVQLQGAGVAEGLVGYVSFEGGVVLARATADGRMTFTLPTTALESGSSFAFTLAVSAGAVNGDVRLAGSETRALLTEIVADNLLKDGFTTVDFGSYRIPSLVTDGEGEVLCLYDVRYGGGDLGTGDGIDVGETYSSDFGKTFSTPHLAIDVENKRGTDRTQKSGWSKDWDIGDVATLYDPVTQTYWLMGITGQGLFGGTPTMNDVVMYTRARGEGSLKWENRTSMQSFIAAQPGVATSSGSLGYGFLAGPGHGFVTTKDVSYVTTNGVAATMPKGTLVFPMQYFVDGSFTSSSVGALYSTDHGKNWNVTARSATTDGPQENCVMELDDGTWYMTAKAGSWTSANRTATTGKFKFFRSTNFSTWEAVGVYAPVPCQQGSCLKLGQGADGRGRYVLCHTLDPGAGVRAKLSLVFGVDTTSSNDAAGIAWDFDNPLVLFADDTGTKGYNSLCLLDASTLGVLYEAQDKIYFLRIDVSDKLK